MPAHELYLGLSRQVPSETGFGLTHIPGDVRQQIAGSFTIEPFTGYACAEVVYGAPLEWTTATGYATAAWHVEDEGGGDPSYVTCQTRTGTGSWSRTSSGTLLHGQGFLFGFVCYPGYETVTLSFGGGWQLRLSRGMARLYWRGALYYQQELWQVEEWSDGHHWLQVYSVGRRLVVRRWQGTEGFMFKAPLPTAGGPTTALGAGQVTIAADGPLSWVVLREAHASSLSYSHLPITMPRGTDNAPSGGLMWFGGGTGATASLSITDENGFAIIPGVGHQSFIYSVSANLGATVGPNLYITAARVRFDPDYADDGNSPVDVVADTDVTVLRDGQITETQSLDPRQSRIKFTLATPTRGELADYKQVNIGGRWCPNGTARRTFLTDNWVFKRGRSRDVLEMEGSELWKRFRSCPWTGGRSYGGWTLAAALADALDQAGIPGLKYSVTGGLYLLPEEDPDGPPLFDFRSEQSVEDVITYLVEQFGAQLLLRYGADGTLYISEPPTVATAPELVWSTPASELEDVADGSSTLPVIIGEWTEQTHEEQLRNHVTVVGRDVWGGPLVATAVDWASIQDRDAANYVGEIRRLIIFDAGLTTAPAVGWVCRQVYERVRQLKVTARVETRYRSEWQVGELVTVEDGGTYRITQVETAWGEVRAGRSTLDLEAV